jgi:hypothetical protein
LIWRVDLTLIAARRTRDMSLDHPNWQCVPQRIATITLEHADLFIVMMSWVFVDDVDLIRTENLL